MGSVSIRDARDSDAAAIASIYNHYVVNSTATFDTESKTVEDRVAWIQSHGGQYPALVAESEGEVVGWGSLSPWHPRPAYDRSVEVSSYIAPEFLGRGIGTQLMEHLIARASEIGHHALISQIVAGNQASIALGERFGYREVGRLPEVGHKFGEWLDVVLMVRLLG